METLTNQMEAEIEAVIARIDDLGGMYEAVSSGAVQRMIGDSAMAFQERVESGAQKVVGVNAYQVDESTQTRPASQRPEAGSMEAYVSGLQRYKAARSQRDVSNALDRLQRACESTGDNVFEQVVAGAIAGLTHGEICACLRRELGFGQPLIVP